MRNKKLLATSLIVALTLTACGKTSNEAPTTTPTPIIEETQDTTTEDVTTEESTEEVEEGVENEEEITETLEVEDMSIASDETLDQIHAAVVEKIGENYVANMPFDSTQVEELFGVKADWYDAGIAEGPMMSVHVDKFLAFHATEGNLENIQTALNAYVETIKADTMQYPMNLNKIQACTVETVGDYVFFVMVGMIDETTYESEDQMIEAYKEINASVIEIAKEIIG